MAESNARTSETIREPLIRQFSVFLENKVGALLDLTQTLGHANVHICGISVVDTADASVVRLVVDDPDHCREALHVAAIPASESNLVVVGLPRGPEQLDLVLRQLVAAEVNIQYTYSLMIHPHDCALLALHCEDPDFAREVLGQGGYKVLTQTDISR